MRLVVDTNRIIAALIRNSYSRKILLHLDAELITIPLLKEEVMKYKEVIITKSGLNETNFNLMLHQLYEKMAILNEDIIKNYKEEAARIMDAIDPDDAQFIAAALATNSDIWSDDPHFQRQKRVKIWKTKDLAEFL